MSEIPHSNMGEAKLGLVWGKTIKGRLVVWEETVVEKWKDGGDVGGGRQGRVRMGGAVQ